MPFYEYRCESCGHGHEAMQRITADPLVTCPSCGADALKRLISQTSFLLKGSGWYATDYKTGPKSSGNGSAKSDGEGSDKGKSVEPTGASSEPKSPAPSTPSTPSSDRSS